MAGVTFIANGQRPSSRNEKEKMSENTNVQLYKFNQFYTYLNDTYIDDVDNVRLIEDAIKEMLSELDPHSAYMSPEEMVGVSESFEGRFSGIGVQINTVNDTLRVAGVIAGGPAEKVGLQPGDRIVTVDGTSIVGMNQMDAIKLLRGDKGSKVNIDVVRLGMAEKLGFRIVRDNISIETIDAAYMPAPGVGYIRVNRFAHTTMQEFKDAFDKFDSPEALILDLRGNSGGLMTQSVTMSNFFLPKGSLVVSTEGSKVEGDEYKATGNPVFPKGKVVVLIDDFSASASEIVAGALQDWDRAVVVGRRSFGKGLVQRQYPLIDGSAVNITIAKYLTPSGRAIQRPYEAGDETAYYKSLSDRFSSGFVDSLDRVDSLRYKTRRLGRSVYGGGGIYPDYYVPIDTLGFTDYLSALVRKGIVYEYVSTYLDGNRDRLLAEYPDFDMFYAGYKVPQDIMDGITELGESRDIPLDETGLKEALPLIEMRIKVYLARSMWGETEAYRISNQKDPVMDKAMEVLRDWNVMSEGIVAR